MLLLQAFKYTLALATRDQFSCSCTHQIVMNISTSSCYTPFVETSLILFVRTRYLVHE